nr:hypothetical protein [Kibdelosporangium sp. MJ126-NF4]CEL21007.1 putative transcription regulator [Kibdelosporangium sp. MJ126-NF4]CTQ95479.1 putative transcription regulator [Kibdelosporangium sp. MJ126-NF4]
MATASAADANSTADAPDAFLGLLRTIGLSRVDALRVHTELGLKLFGFALLVDYREPAELPPVPAAWLTDDMDLPHLTEALAGRAPSPDELFDHITGTLILSIEAALG